MKVNSVLFYMLLAFAGLLFAEEVSHQTDKEAVLAVHVSNGTQEGKVAEGSPVTVLFYHGDHIVKEAEALTGPDGNCEIQDIPTGEGIVAVAQAKHSDMAFSSAPLALEPGQKQYDLALQVFDVAYDNSLIRAGTHHLIIKKSGSNVHVTEYLQLVNDLDRAILSAQKDEDGNPEVIQISLPENFKDLAFSSYFHSDAVVQTASGFYDTMAIPPGSYHGVFSYNVPLSTEVSDFKKIVTLPTASMMVFIQADGGITAELGEPAGQMNLKDGTATNYYTVDVSPGDVLIFHAEGIPAPPSQLNLWIVLSIVFAIVLTAALIRLIKPQPIG